MTELLLLSGASEASGGVQIRLPGSQLILLKKKRNEKAFYDKMLSARLFKEAAGKSGALHTAAAKIFFAQNVVMFSHLMWHFDKKTNKKNPQSTSNVDPSKLIMRGIKRPSEILLMTRTSGTAFIFIFISNPAHRTWDCNTPSLLRTYCLPVLQIWAQLGKSKTSEIMNLKNIQMLLFHSWEALHQTQCNKTMHEHLLGTWFQTRTPNYS